MTPQTPAWILGVHGDLEPKSAQIVAPLVVPWTDGATYPFDFGQEQQAGSLISHMSTLTWSHLYVSGPLTTNFNIVFSSGQRIHFTVVTGLDGNIPVIAPNPIQFQISVKNTGGAVGQTLFGLTNFYPRHVTYTPTALL